MRKLLSFLLISALAFTACSGKVFKDEAEAVSINGVLSAQENNDNYAGTHLIINETGDITPIRSLNINLSDEKYLNNDVKLLGFYDEDDNVFEATGITVVEILHPVNGERLFIPYKNEALGVQLKYYTDWEIDESENEITFQAVFNELDAEKIVISRESFNYSPTEVEKDNNLDALKAYFESLPEEEITYLAALDQEYKKIGPDQLDAAEIHGDDFVSFTFYRPDYIYNITLIPGTTETFEENLKIFQEMMAEFRFIPINIDSDINSEDSDEEESSDSNDEDVGASELPELDLKFVPFESLPYSFKGEYPGSWYYAGAAGSKPGVLRHYSFSDEPLSEEDQPVEELIGLDVISTDIPTGQKKNIAGHEVTTTTENGNYTVYVKVDDQKFRISGKKDYSDVILYMVTRLEILEDEE